MASANNVGYKRTKRGENPMPNDLFDIEIAPSELDVDGIFEKYANKIQNLSEQLSKKEKEQKQIIIKQKQTGPDKKKIDKLQIELNKLSIAKEKVEEERDKVNEFVEKYYDHRNLRREYTERTDKDLLNCFNTGLLKDYKSKEILLRQTTKLKILDALRQDVSWN